MTINRVLTLAAILVAATVLLVSFWATHRQVKRTRVYLSAKWKIPEAEFAQATKYYREACPDVILIDDQQRADYRLLSLWNGKAWFALVTRKNSGSGLFFKQDSPDAMETFRQSCAAIRKDAKELADSEPDTTSMPVGRYLMHSTNPKPGILNDEGRIFLLDTKTGEVWQLEPVGNTQEFGRISVEGLYDNRGPGEGPGEWP